MKFVHKAYQPVLYHGIPNLQRSDDPASEYWQWWEEQYRRCLHGYKPDGYQKIAGRYYFYLNFCKIKMSDGTREFISHPYYRDLDHELSEIFEQAKREHKGIILPKAREKGITYDCLGQAILHEVVFYEGSEVGIGTAIPKYMEKASVNTVNILGKGLEMSANLVASIAKSAVKKVILKGIDIGA